MADEAGIAAITIARSTHHGASGVYALAAARAGYAAIVVTHADPAVVPFGGTRPFYGTNPIAFAVPAPGEEPMLLDMATSAIPFNRVFLRRATGTPLPPEVARDAHGDLTTDPWAARAVRATVAKRDGLRRWAARRPARRPRTCRASRGSRARAPRACPSAGGAGRSGRHAPARTPGIR